MQSLKYNREVKQFKDNEIEEINGNKGWMFLEESAFPMSNQMIPSMNLT